jgi:putative SOS response-associated peptidase YedK
MASVTAAALRIRHATMQCAKAWQKAGKLKVPHFIRLQDEKLFAFAGIYDEWRGSEGEMIDSFALLTTRPNSLMAPIHDRMTVILPQCREDEWLQTDGAKIEQLIEQLCEPCAAGELQAFPISPLVNSPINDSAEILIRPVQLAEQC